MHSPAISTQPDPLRTKVNQVVVPGDVIGEVTSSGIKLGVGLIQDKSNVIATKAGILRCKEPDTFFIENSQKRYVPSLDDLVIGKVVECIKDSYKVDIGAYEFAMLSYFSSESATKKHHLELSVSSLVYCRVTVASKDMQPEIQCLSIHGKKDGFGPLNDGVMFECSTGLARDCLSENSTILNELGKHFAYEVAPGINGRIWVNSDSVLNTILIANAIQNSASLTEEQIPIMVRALLKSRENRSF